MWIPRLLGRGLGGDEDAHFNKLPRESTTDTSMRPTDPQEQVVDEDPGEKQSPQSGMKGMSRK